MLTLSEVSVVLELLYIIKVIFKSNQNNQKLSMQVPNKFENNENKYQYEEVSKNQNNSGSNESLSNDIPEIEVIEVEKINPEETCPSPNPRVHSNSPPSSW